MSKKFGGAIPSPWDSYDQAALDSVNGALSKSWDDKRYSKTALAPRCYESHPPLPLVKEGQTYFIYGGSCSSPVVLDADVYIGFDYLKPKHPRFPWNPVEDAVLEIAFPIQDMHAPSNPEEFKKMITWVCAQVLAGKKVHAGCIGGHGRTGTFLAAVVAEFMGEKDAITYVRANYCKKAVETASQIAFLGTHFDILPTKGSKASLFPAAPGASWPASKATQPSGAWKTSLGSKPTNVVPLPPANKVAFSGATKVLHPVPSARCVWGKKT